MGTHDSSDGAGNDLGEFGAYAVELASHAVERAIDIIAIQRCELARAMEGVLTP